MERSTRPVAGRAQGGRARSASLVVASALGFLVFGAGAAISGEPLRLDRSAGSYAGLVWFVASVPDAPEADLFVGLAIGRLADSRLEQALALEPGSAGPELVSPGTLPADLMRPGRAVIEVQVDYRAFDQIRHLIARWSEGEQEDVPPPVRMENLLDRVARTIGLKAPYRSVLRGSDPVVYVRDLARINGGG